MSEEIKPWTYRQQLSPAQLSSQKQKETKQVSRDKPSIKNRQPSQSDVCGSIDKPLQLPLLQSQAILRAKRLINEKLAENLGISMNVNQQSNFLPNYKFINICFSIQGSKKSKKDKKVPYHINCLRQYTHNHDLRNENVQKNKPQGGKIKRYYTEERKENKNSINENISYLESTLTKMERKPCQLPSRNDPSLKLIRHKHKSIQQSQKYIQKGALYEQIDKLCNIKSIKSNKLTFMKRTYNLKRLQKILS